MFQKKFKVLKGTIKSLVTRLYKIVFNVSNQFWEHNTVLQLSMTEAFAHGNGGGGEYNNNIVKSV